MNTEKEIQKCVDYIMKARGVFDFPVSGPRMSIEGDRRKEEILSRKRDEDDLDLHGIFITETATIAPTSAALARKNKWHEASKGVDQTPADMRPGKFGVNKAGERYEIIAYNGGKNVTVRFVETGNVYVAQSSNLRRGQIRDKQS